MSILFQILAIAPPVLLAVVLHEVAHGVMAELQGDNTARDQGRISLNPIRHIDPFMTIILPVMLSLAGAPIFAGALPVPVNPLRFRNPRRGMAYVALAGPIVNFALALACYLTLLGIRPLFAEIDQAGMGIAALSLVAIWLEIGLRVNATLAVFNLLPIPPLDGGRIAVGFLPIVQARALAKLEPWGIVIVFALLYFGVLDFVLGPLLTWLGKL